ncbi:MAG: DUF6754 domain-containing protein [Candidatus Zixiibacteriota bacterium]
MEAVDEAVGRATEMGKKIVFVPGISDMDNMQTIAGLSRTTIPSMAAA